MVDFDVNENLNNITQEQRDNIKEAVNKVLGKMRPDSISLDYLFQMFKDNIDPKFNGRCGKCKKRVLGYWSQRLKSWEMS
jgi:hypothetical protein